MGSQTSAQGCLFFIILLLLLLHGLECDPGTSHEDLPGHMQPLGSHMAPEQVRRISHLPSPMEFYDSYVLPKTPVIMEGALRNSPVWRKWQDDEYIREHFGEEEVGIEQGKKENRSDPRFTLTVSQFLDRYKEEDIYLVYDLTPPMYQEWAVPRPLLCGGFTDHFMVTYMWFSSGGTKSVLHTDSFENYHCLVSGRKEFVLIEPHYASVIGPEHARKGYFDVDVEKVDMSIYPELAKIPWVRAVVNEGDCLYLPYHWIHSVSSFERNMGINIWWIQFDFDGSDCPPPGEELPEYFQLGDVELSPEMQIMEALSRAARPDGSLHAGEFYKMIQTADGMGFIELHHVEQLVDLLEPGCNGVIADYKSIPRPLIRKAYQYLLSLNGEVEIPEGDEQYDPLDEFGGAAEMDHDPDHMTEGGGDFDSHRRDEL